MNGRMYRIGSCRTSSIAMQLFLSTIQSSIKFSSSYKFLYNYAINLEIAKHQKKNECQFECEKEKTFVVQYVIAIFVAIPFFFKSKSIFFTHRYFDYNKFKIDYFANIFSFAVQFCHFHKYELKISLNVSLFVPQKTQEQRKIKKHHTN